MVPYNRWTHWLIINHLYSNLQQTNGHTNKFLPLVTTADETTTATVVEGCMEDEVTAWVTCSEDVVDIDGVIDASNDK